MLGEQKHTANTDQRAGTQPLLDERKGGREEED